MTGAWILYTLALVLAVMFWRLMRGHSLEDLFALSRQHHHHVLKVLERHPTGGAWREVRAWMGEEE